MEKVNLKVTDIRTGNKLLLFLNGNKIPCQVVQINGFSNSLRVNYLNPDSNEAKLHPIRESTAVMDQFEGILLDKETMLNNEKWALFANKNFIIKSFEAATNWLRQIIYLTITINPNNGITYIHRLEDEEIKMPKKYIYHHQLENLINEIV